MRRARFAHTYEDIISAENLLHAWNEFLKGKRRKLDVQEFGHYLFANIQKLHTDLKEKRYEHGTYQSFNISDPKPRNIHKATVRDRLLHHAIYRQLYPFFNRTFIADSYSCRLNKGTHEAIKRFRQFAQKASRNYTKTVWILKCDIRKFFASVDQEILMKILSDYISDPDIIWLIERVVGSFNSGSVRKGLPLGNLTSQLLVNIYMNEFDQFAKHKLKAKFYVRYADDFVVLSENKSWLEALIPRIAEFLESYLVLSLHPNKLSIHTLASGVDFLGWIHFPNHKVLRSSTKRKMLRRARENPTEETVQSYLGLLSHGNAQRLRIKVLGARKP